MAILDGDILRITDKQVQGTEEILNVFWYIIEVFIAGVTLLEVIDEFVDVVIGAEVEMQNPLITHFEVVAENMTNGIDIETDTIDLPGIDAGSGPALPTYVAGAYGLVTVGKTTRDGSKRIGGMGESRVDGNEYTPDLTKDTAFRVALKTAIEVVSAGPGVASAVPVVVGRNLLGQPDLARVSPVTAISRRLNITTQNSRKVIV